MTRDQIAAVGVGLAGLAALAVLSIDVPGDTKDPGSERVVEASKVGVLPDGGKAYVVKVALTDGGIEMRKISAPDCVRRPKGAAVDTCLALVGGKGVDRGELNRFPADASVGGGCEPVACSITLGEDPEISDDARVQDYKSRKDGGK